jgi:hypothetical protein
MQKTFAFSKLGNFFKNVLFQILKGTVARDYLFQIFSWITSPKPLKITLWIFSKIRGDFRKSRCPTGINDTGCKFVTGVNNTDRKTSTSINGTSSKFATGINDTGDKFCHQFRWCCWYRLQISHRCQRCRWQTMGIISDCWQLKLNLKEIFFLYADSTTQRCKGVQKIQWKLFCLKIFSICHRCQRHRWCTLSCEYLFLYLYLYFYIYIYLKRP